MNPNPNAPNPPEIVIAAAERQLRALAISNRLRDLVQGNLDAMRSELAGERA